MGAALDELLEILDLERIEDDVFRGRSPQESAQRVFGGQVAGQALVAAGRTVPLGRAVHSLHAYFLRPGDPSVPLLYQVDRSRDGQSFSVRRVVAVQHGRPVFTLSASFQVADAGLEHQDTMPAAPDPETLPSIAERLAAAGGELGGEATAWWSRPRPIDVRHVEEPVYLMGDGHPGEPRQMVWMRAAGALGDQPLLHECVVTYASDMTLLDSVLRAHGHSWSSGRLKVASLDHAMWFHRPFRADEWLLYVQESPSASGARGFARGQIFTHDGRLVVSVAQEGMVRVVEPR
ncbi:MAG: acyl-CoA thioesterase II [Actinomycetes bacterium]